MTVPSNRLTLANNKQQIVCKGPTPSMSRTVILVKVRINRDNDYGKSGGRVSRQKVCK